MLTSATAIEVGQYSEEEGGRDCDGVSTLLQHLLVPSHHLHMYTLTLYVLYTGMYVCTVNSENGPESDSHRHFCSNTHIKDNTHLQWSATVEKGKVLHGQAVSNSQTPP